MLKIRLKDVAQKAGVSPASVSNVLNGKGGVSDATAVLIRSIAQDMGYSTGKNMAQRKGYVRFVSFKRHGLVVMDTQFFAEIIEALENQCHQAGIKMMISSIHLGNDVDYRDRIREICQEDSAGILLLATEMYSQDVELFSQTKAPLVVVDSLFRNQRFNCVMMDNYDAGYQATSYLINKGHTRIEHITTTVRLNNMKYRRLGYEAAMADAKLSTSDSLNWQVTPTLEGAYRDMLALLEHRKGMLPTAFFAANDIIAVGCLRAFHERGYRVPDDVSIIGMDDLAICQVANPTLSTIRVFRDDIARVAVQRLLDMMGDNCPRCILKIQVGVELVERQSVNQIS